MSLYTKISEQSGLDLLSDFKTPITPDHIILMRHQDRIQLINRFKVKECVGVSDIKNKIVIASIGAILLAVIVKAWLLFRR